MVSCNTALILQLNGLEPSQPTLPPWLRILSGTILLALAPVFHTLHRSRQLSMWWGLGPPTAYRLPRPRPIALIVNRLIVAIRTPGHDTRQFVRTAVLGDRLAQGRLPSSGRRWTPLCRRVVRYWSCAHGFGSFASALRMSSTVSYTLFGPGGYVSRTTTASSPCVYANCIRRSSANGKHTSRMPCIRPVDDCRPWKMTVEALRSVDWRDGLGAGGVVLSRGSAIVTRISPFRDGGLAI